MTVECPNNAGCPPLLKKVCLKLRLNHDNKYSGQVRYYENLIIGLFSEMPARLEFKGRFRYV